MSKRPRSITVIGWLFVAVGSAGFVRSLLGLADAGAWQRLMQSSHEMTDFAWVIASATVALLGGAFTLRGCDWARWLLAVWMAGHVAIGFMHTPFAGITHAVLFAVIAYFLFRPEAAAYFRPTKAAPPNPAPSL